MPVSIPLYRGRGKASTVIGHTVIDDADLFAVEHLKWTLHDGYAVAYYTAGTRKTVMVRMHRLLVGLLAGDKREADHIDRDRLNNQRSNLRIVAPAANRQNRESCRTSRFGARTSRHRGVCWDKARRKWTAYASVHHRRHFLGHFATEEDAARVAAEFRARQMPYATS